MPSNLRSALNVRGEACGVNPVDWCLMLGGLYTSFTWVSSAELPYSQLC